MINSELVVFIVYLLAVVGIGVYFFARTKGKGNEKDYFLGNREMHPFVTALSAGASDMSAWVLMGLPAAIYTLGMGQTWIAIGLAIGYALSWILLAPRLRKFSIAAGDSITLPQYLTNRFLSQSKVLQVICAVIFVVAYAVYAAASIKACGTLFNTVLGVNENAAMYVAALIIVAYTFLGGFKAVCWTDFFQGMLMLGALMLAPIFALFLVNSGNAVAADAVVFPENYWNFFSSGKLDWKSWSDILSGIGWGLGYFGMPHIIIRFMSVRSQREVKKGAIVGISWNILILTFAVLAGCAGRIFLGEIEDSATVFIQMVRGIFPAVISGVLLSAILAAAMSTADSQLLVSASAFGADVYKPILRGKGLALSQKEKLISGLIALILGIQGLFYAITTIVRDIDISRFSRNLYGFTYMAPFSAHEVTTVVILVLSIIITIAGGILLLMLKSDKECTDKEMFWAGRILVVLIAFAALAIASNPASGTIMSLVGNAWGIFGAAFGPVILFSVFWKRFTFKGAVAGIITGALVDILWLTFLSGTGLFEIIPGFIAGTIAAVVITLNDKKPGAEIEALYDRSVALTD